MWWGDWLTESLTLHVISASAEANELNAWLLRKQLGLEPLIEVTLPHRAYAVWNVSSKHESQGMQKLKSKSSRIKRSKIRGSKKSGP